MTDGARSVGLPGAPDSRDARTTPVGEPTRGGLHDNPARDPGELHREFEAVWGNPSGVASGSVVNHSLVSIRFMVTGGVFFLIAGVLAMLMRVQLARPDHGVVDAELYAQLFTMHGTMMMFLFAVPVMEGLGAYLLPKMLGARDLVFPRLAAFGYWCYLFGGIVFTSSLAFELAPDAGWFMYVPLSSGRWSPGVNADFWLIGITFIEISAVAAGVEIAVSILRTRARGMSLARMPVFAWAMLVTSMMIITGFPPLILGSILLELERAAGFPFFDVERGGDPILWQHLFWLFGHPEVYIIFLPAAGVVSTIVPVFARRPLVGYRWVVVALVSTGFLSFGLWVHHMFTIGIPALAQAFFSAASMLVAIPTGVQLFAWLATLWLGRPVWRAPMLWIGGFLFVFVCGGLTGVMLALVPFDWQVHDTHFVVAHMHYVLVGGMLFPLIAGLYYWLPQFSGRLPSERLSRWGFWLVFLGFNGTFLVMHWTGLLGMPRRVYTYPTGLGWDGPNLVSTVSGFVMAIGVATVLLDLVLHWRRGPQAAPNPWGADTLEWASGMPARSYNFASLPDVTDRHPLWREPELVHTIPQGRHALPDARHGRRETLGSDPISGEPREVIHLPGNSWLPMISAGVLAVVCVALLAKTYAVAIVGAAAALGVLLRWSWLNGAHPSMLETEHEDLPEGLQLHTRTFDGPGLWGMGLTLVADAALYGSLLFGWVYLWTVAPAWQAPTEPLFDAGTTGLLLVSLALCAVGAGAKEWSVRRLRRGRVQGLQARALVAGGAGLLAAAALVALLGRLPLEPAGTAHDAVVAVMLGYLLLHVAAAGVFSLLQARRIALGYVGARAPYEPLVVALWWRYTLGALLIGAAALGLWPLAFGEGP